MAYAPYKEEKPVRQFTANLDGLITWLETQNPSTGYEWYETRACLVCRFHQARGIAEPWGKPDSLYSELFNSIEEYWAVGLSTPWTFGAALERARALRTASAP